MNRPTTRWFSFSRTLGWPSGLALSLTLVGLGLVLHPATALQQERGLVKVATPEEPPLELTVRVNGKSGTLIRALESGDGLASGSHLEFLLSVDRPAFVYVVQRFADETAAVLYPELGDFQVPGNLEVRIPESGSWFQLDDQIGEEHIYFVASIRPLAEVDRAVHTAVERAREEGTLEGEATAEDEVASAAVASQAAEERPESPKPSGGPVAETTPKAPSAAPAPLPAGLGTRGLVKTLGTGGAEVTADESGLAIYHFWLQHHDSSE